jgi:hypothetical protein
LGDEMKKLVLGLVGGLITVMNANAAAPQTGGLMDLARVSVKGMALSRGPSANAVESNAARAADNTGTVSADSDAAQITATQDAIAAAIAAAEAAKPVLNFELPQSCEDALNLMDSVSTLSTATGVISGVGTVANTVALGTGLAKSSVDEQVADIDAEIEKMSPSYKLYQQALALESEYAALEAEKKELEEKSKTLGNVRTGTLAGGAVLSAGSAVTAGLTSGLGLTDSDFDKIMDLSKQCNAEIDAILKQQATTAEEVQKIAAVRVNCRPIDIDAIDKFETMMIVSGWSSVVGGVAGVAGTVTSYNANTDETRNDNTDAGKSTEANLNTASNVLAGGAAATSLASTILSAMTSSGLGDVQDKLEDCVEFLKEELVVMK